MLHESSFDFDILETALRGHSALDISRIHVSKIEEAEEFLLGYGFNMQDPEDLEALWSYHFKVVQFFKNKLLQEGEDVPTIISERGELKNIGQILIWASDPNSENHDLKVWSCAFIKALHMLVHLDNDLFTFFTDDIQYQILRPIQSHLVQVPQTDELYLGDPSDPASVQLAGFEIKPFKDVDSAILKLLAKRDAVALTLLDRVGIRFVTKRLVDVLRVIQYLISHNVISYAHIVSSESKNSICPVGVLKNAWEETSSHEKGMRFYDDLEEKIRIWMDQGNFLPTEKANTYSHDEHRFLKFINRQFLKVDMGPNRKPLRFFYPFEIQVIDEETQRANLTGEASHQAYKQRQIESVRKRLFGSTGVPRI